MWRLRKLHSLLLWRCLAMAMAILLGTRPSCAATQIDCKAVVNQLNSGQHEKDVAKDLNTTLYQVRRCKRKARATAKAETKSSVYSKKGRDVPVAPSSAAGTTSQQLGIVTPTFMSVIAFSDAMSLTLPRVPYLTFLNTFFLSIYLFVAISVLETVAIYAIGRAGNEDLTTRLHATGRAGSSPFSTS
jgi:uncharacterized protein (DUF433 family)